MDPKLAEVYGTNQPNEADVEALATAALAEKLAAADELDVSGMSDEEAEALASEILGVEAAEDDEQPAAEEPAEGEEKVAGEEPASDLTPEQEKIAEADYLGRVMAHAYVQERGLIEKKAAAEAATKAKTAGKKDMGKVMEAVKGKDKKASAQKTKKASAEGEEQMSALDQLALARAHEILKEHGVDPDAEPEQEKKSSIDEDKAKLLAQKVDERAMQMIEEAGYTFEEKEEVPAQE